ncbi:unnamed protein product [Gordionus sp. m RMFG-2023]
MHRDVVTHINVTKTDFIITASQDGHIKFWKKGEEGIEFVKHFKAHLSGILDVSVSYDGALYATVSEDQAMKIFDVINFDMINIFKFDYIPITCEWIYIANDPLKGIAVSHSLKPYIYIYDGYGENVPIHVFENLHRNPIINISFNPIYEIALSIDNAGMIEYWTGPKKDFIDPIANNKKNFLHFSHKTDTDLYELAKYCNSNNTKVCICSSKLSFSPDGKLFGLVSLNEEKVRIFRFDTGKLWRVYSEDRGSLSEAANNQKLPLGTTSLELNRRLAIERELLSPYSHNTPNDNDNSLDLEAIMLPRTNNLVFDSSGNFVIYSTILGIRILNLITNKCSRMLGVQDNLRFLNIALFQGRASASKYLESSVPDPVALEIEALSDESKPRKNDPVIFATAFRKNRFYIFSNREPNEDITMGIERDIFNEKPTKEDMLAVPEIMASGGINSLSNGESLSTSAVLHTTLGDIHCKLYANDCPKTVQNFCIHARNGYFNGHIFHRVIKGFMIQTGDPTGTGTGGESIWGHEFEDEIVAHLRHDKPFTLSMANAGPNTNGSQFFITVVPCSWLDKKHTIFGLVTRGMDVVNKINNANTDPDTDKPYDDVTIISVSLK